MDRRQVFVQRVIGAPGDHIRLAGKIVYRTGAALNDHARFTRRTYVDSYRDNFPSEPDTALPPAAQEMLAKHVVNGELIVPRT